jgi:phosphatidylinositol alpha-1,6-mannosyltransferase
MNIAIYTPEFGLEKGGIQTWAFYINQAFKVNNYNSFIYPIKDSKLTDMFSIFRSYYVCDIFLLMTWKMMIAILPAIFLSKKRIVIFIHGNDFLELPFYQKSLLKILIKRKNTKFIANSNYISNLFEKLYARKPDGVFYPFIDAQIKPFSKQPEAVKQLFTISRLVKRKNIVNVLLALKKLKEKGFRFEYRIAGTGPEYGTLKHYITELGLKDSVSLLGRISEEEKNNCYANADLFLLPSVYDEVDGSIEGYGIVYIEANLFGTPCISGDSGGIPEAVLHGVTGFNTDGSVEDIVHYLEKAWDYKFDDEKIQSHALMHDFRNSGKFFSFLFKRKVMHFER